MEKNNGLNWIRKRESDGEDRKRIDQSIVRAKTKNLMHLW